MSVPSKVIRIVTSGPQGAVGPRGERGIQGPSGSADGAWIRTNNDVLYYDEGPIGIGDDFGVVDIEASLHVNGNSLMKSLMLRETNYQASNELFVIRKLEVESGELGYKDHFVVNAEGVTVLGQFVYEPTPVAGGLYYSIDGNFYLGFNQD